DFVVEDLSNWYVRRNRARFWNSDDDADQRAAFRTLYDALRQVALLAAPCTPFSSDWLHRALTGESVHLQRFPSALGASERDALLAGEDLEGDMDAVRTLVSLGRAAREDVQIRVRQPLRQVRAVVPGGRTLSEEMLEVVRDELNVKEVGFLSTSEGLVSLTAKPNYRSLGSRFGKRTNDVANRIRALSEEDLRAYQATGMLSVELNGESHDLGADDLDVIQEASGGLAVKGEGAYTVALDPSLDDELRAEGVARELVNRIQRLRRDAGLEISDRIELRVAGSKEIRTAAESHRDFIGGEVLAAEMNVVEAIEEGDLPHVREVDIDGTPATLGLRPSVG
ncbi:MAG: class I tRNA ligase family protein, partial [Gemmatimonadetes bacterium]|nr:class I tRNA ligase family protein [Gemmatimonadota bacterium]